MSWSVLASRDQQVRVIDQNSTLQYPLGGCCSFYSSFSLVGRVVLRRKGQSLPHEIINDNAANESLMLECLGHPRRLSRLPAAWLAPIRSELIDRFPSLVLVCRSWAKLSPINASLNDLEPIDGRCAGMQKDVESRIFVTTRSLQV